MEQSKPGTARAFVVLTLLFMATFFNQVAHTPMLQVSPEQLATHLAQTKKQGLSLHIAEKYRISRVSAKEIVAAAFTAASSKGVSPYLVLGIIAQESSFRSKAASGYGAVGLMQVVPRWHPEKLTSFKNPRKALLNPKTNVTVGVQVLAEYLKRGKGVHWALAKYSGKAVRYGPKVLAYAQSFAKVARSSPTQV